MIKSMTGYGKGEAVHEAGRFVVEVRCVNHRYGEITVKLPRVLLQFENEIKKRVGERLVRGKIDVFIQVENAVALGVPTANLPLARGYLKAFQTIGEALGLSGEVDLALVASQRDVVTVAAEAEATLEEMPQELMSALEEALRRVDEMRLFEGESLYADFQRRRETLAQLIGKVAARAPQVVAEYGQRLKERIAQLLGEASLPEERLVQEVAVMADKCDVTEELVRLESHLRQFDETLAKSEPVGRKLDFLLQEINREVNTIGSKGNDAQMAALVVELKAELEKIREQVQNIE
ncbi:YicC family protein [Geomonas subterranea]|uniref:YicC family protein n=1 Tax=Geomonas subterranea TaxID=2847989 RepID=A0ABX8LBG7_9BACT|nr:YicC/YloC family endoribonuclease [Geomonas subterranea]QXE88993.1 YicC family protein [Geomonas subterranea]QXM08889.1 YicC family protein [Geomonas subterranea]